MTSEKIWEQESLQEVLFWKEEKPRSC